MGFGLGNVGVKEGCLEEGVIAADACAVCGVGRRIKWRGRRRLSVSINLNTRWAGQGE
jgi:hypothetical protein